MKIKNGFKFKKNGWNYISIRGNPSDRGCCSRGVCTSRHVLGLTAHVYDERCD